MSIPRRTFLRGGLLTAGGALVVERAATARAATPHHPVNRPPPRPSSYLRLPPGAVRPTGWLATRLDRQVTGLTGRYQEFSHFLRFADTGWTRPDLDGWEEVPHWLRGYGDLGYVTGNERVLGDTERWIDAIVATRASDGYFGPSRLRTALNGHADLWPHMPVLHALRSWAEHRGDTRIDGMLTRYFRFVAAQPDGVFSDGWGATIDVLYWLFNRTGDTALLDLTRRVHQHSANWVDRIASPHNVNFAQGFREPAQFWQLSGDDRHRASAHRTYDSVMTSYGQFPGGGFAGDENSRPGCGDPRQGFETCGVVEFMGSHELLLRTTGDPVRGDRTEELAFNLLPASLDPQGKAVHYVTSANGVRLDNSPKRRRQFQNGFAMQAYVPGVDDYRCCPHNYGQGWPYYVEEMWLATPDGGLAAAPRGPSRVSAKVGDGTVVTVVADTGSPFTDTITFTLTTPRAVAFPFSVRIPGWCPNPVLTVNGTAVAAPGGPRFASVDRTWTTGDQVVLRLPMTPRTRVWTRNHNAVSVDLGALTFSLRVEERWNRYAGSADWPEYEVEPGSAWNVGLTPDQRFVVSSGGSLTDPFTLATAPVRISARVRDIPDWEVDSENVVGTLSDGPVATTGAERTVELVPMGAARLRITAFPQTGGTRTWGTPGVLCRVQNENSDKVLSTSDARVVQFADDGGADHRWTLVDNGDGWFRLRNVHSGKVLAVDRMSTADSARVVQFDDSGTPDHLRRLS